MLPTRVAGNEVELQVHDAAPLAALLTLHPLHERDHVHRRRLGRGRCRRWLLREEHHIVATQAHVPAEILRCLAMACRALSGKVVPS
jgi:hypothetical protein